MRGTRKRRRDQKKEQRDQSGSDSLQAIEHSLSVLISQDARQEIERMEQEQEEWRERERKWKDRNEELRKKLDELTEKMEGLCHDREREREQTQRRETDLESKIREMEKKARTKGDERPAASTPSRMPPEEPQASFSTISRPSTGTTGPTNILVKDIPTFTGETPAMQAMKRNQEVEVWIRTIEHRFRDAMDEDKIAAAKAHCRGRADNIVNSPVFDGVHSWIEFAAKLRSKFKVACSAAAIFDLLQKMSMKNGQSPADFHLDLESLVYAGYREHERAFGDPEEVVRRYFVQGIPNWLRELLITCKNAPINLLVEAAQEGWELRVGTRQSQGGTRVSRTEEPKRWEQQVYEASWEKGDEARAEQSTPDRSRYVREERVRTPPRGRRTLTPERPYTPPRDRRRRSPESMWTTQSAREERRLPPTCWSCGYRGHVMRWCPFSKPRGEEGSTPSGTLREPIDQGAHETETGRPQRLTAVHRGVHFEEER